MFMLTNSFQVAKNVFFLETLPNVTTVIGEESLKLLSQTAGCIT